MYDFIGRSVLVNGSVQGVFFRATAAEVAKKLGLHGWVKNLPSGQVLVEVFGLKSDVDDFIEWCRQGPPMATVSDLKVEKIPMRDEGDFRVEY